MASDSVTSGTTLEEPRMEDRNALLVAGLMKTYDAETMHQIPLLWQELSPHIGKMPGQVDGKAYGVIYYLKANGGVAYMAGVEVSAASDVPEEFSVVRIPDTTCAIFSHPGHVSTIKDQIFKIFNEWLPASGLTIVRPDDEMPDVLERYGEAFDPSTGSGDIEIWVPIKNRARLIEFDPFIQP
jgi:AraC family transcriptional regulator